MKRKVFNALMLIVMTILISCNACYAALSSALHEPAWGAASGDNYSRVAVRFADARKLLGDLYPGAFLEAFLPYSSDLYGEEFVKLGNIMKALSESNIGEFTAMLAFDELKGRGLIEAGMIMSVPGGGKILEDAVNSGKLSKSMILSALGDNVLKALSEFNSGDFTYERDSDGVFEYRGNYICVDGDRIMFFKTKEGALSAALAVRSGDYKKAVPGSPNVISAHIRKEMAGTSEDINIETAISYEESTWKIKTVTNAFKLLQEMDNKLIESEKLEKALKVLETLPMVGKGAPFFTVGGNTFIDGIDEIEEQLMKTGDMNLTLNWAAFLQMAQQFGISKSDVADLLSGSAAVVFGLDSKFLNIPLPVGGYFTFTGKNGAAKKIIDAASEALAQTGIAAESKINGWDSVYSIVFEPSIQGAVIAQRDETILFGIMNPEDINSQLNLKDIGINTDKMLSWVTLDTEVLWKYARGAYIPISAMLLAGVFGNISDAEKDIIQFTGDFLKTDFPLKSLKSWMPSPEELNMDVSMNPSSGGAFWKIFLEFALRLINNVK